MEKLSSSLPKHYFVDAQYQDIHKQMPAFYYNPQGERDVETTVDETTVMSTVSEPKISEDRPTATIHAGLLAIYYNPEAPSSPIWLNGSATRSL